MTIQADRALARTDTSAVERNCRRLAELVGPHSMLCAVVKANAYGHGDAWCAPASLSGGAKWLAVATAAEAEEVRHHHIEAPVLVMGALTSDEAVRALRADADVVVWQPGFLEAVTAHAKRLGREARVHIKFDSGMGRLGTSEPDLVAELADQAARDEGARLVGLMTHFASADEPESDFAEEQLNRFLPLAEAIKARHRGVIAHAANSAAALRLPSSRLDMVRCGISIYGLDPFHNDPAEHGLEPALSLESYVASVKLVAAGESVGYGRKWVAKQPTWVAVLPLGYGDGVRRGLSATGEALIGGRRFPIAGTISMDNIAVELGPETDVKLGQRATLIGAQGGERILTEDVAKKLGTINYEVTCGISARVRRVFHRD